jgi:hypothetical protein
LLLLLALAVPIATWAQGPVQSISSLSVSLWPDYDRPSVLVIMTGALAPGAPLPATVTVPYPASAQLNAVARIDAQGRMIDDIEYSHDAGVLRFTTPDRGFRVEYYDPYRVDGQQHDYTFDWTADVAVDRLELAVQQPVHAASLVTVPAAVRVVEVEGGLRNHLLPVQNVPAGQQLGVAVSYAMPAPMLSVQALAGKAGAQGAAPPAGAAPAPPTPKPESGALGWGTFIGIVAAVFVVAVVVWQLERRRSAAGSGRAEAPSSGGEARARFCHQCGRPIAAEDRFCSGCGTSLADR